jgi:hypothetical protein
MFVVGDIVNAGVLTGVIKNIHYSGVTPMNYLITYPSITSNYVDQWISAERLSEYNKDLIRGRKLDELGV